MVTEIVPYISPVRDLRILKICLVFSKSKKTSHTAPGKRILQQEEQCRAKFKHERKEIKMLNCCMRDISFQSPTKSLVCLQWSHDKGAKTN